MNARLISAVTSPLEGVNVSKLCKANGISTKTFYKWRNRYQDEGLEGLYERSRRPGRVQSTVSDLIADQIVAFRSSLVTQGKDFGPASIHDALIDAGSKVIPSEATIWRLLKSKGLITPEPKKKPKSATLRFESALPNETWQIDATEWKLSRGRKIWIFNIIDDHSRLLIASFGVTTASTENAWKAFSQGISAWGLPTRCLSDNGLAFTGRLKNYVVEFERQLQEVGIKKVNSRPYHPQTCGKVERFQQTLKRWLKAQPLCSSITELQNQLDEFERYYNYERRHRGIGRITPFARWSGQKPAHNNGVPLEPPTRRSTSICHAGVVNAERYRIGIGAEYSGKRLEVVLDEQRALVFYRGRLVRALIIDRTKGYQASGLSSGRRTKAS